MRPAMGRERSPGPQSPGFPYSPAVCYAPVLLALIRQWSDDPDMGHGFFVPIIAGAIAWHKRDQIAGLIPKPNWWGLAIMAWAGFQLYVATLGAELFLARTSLVISIIGAVILLGGTRYAKVFAFPLFLLFFMVPIPAVIYNQLTFPLQQIASSFAETLIGWTGKSRWCARVISSISSFTDSERG